MLVQKSIVPLRHSSRLVEMPPQSAQQSDVGTELVSRPTGTPADALKSWYQQYTAQDGDYLKPENAIIKAVKSDVLDHEQIEAEVQQLIPEIVVAKGMLWAPTQDNRPA